MLRILMKVKNLFFILIPTLVLLTTATISNVFDNITNNLTGLSDLRKIAEAGLRDTGACRSGELDYYPSFAECIKDSISGDVYSGIELIDRVGLQKYPERKVLLNIYKGRFLGQVGDYSASCNLFQQSNATQDMQLWAESAFAEENWEALSAYLYCLGDPSTQYLGVSSPRISVLFNNLGKYYSKMGQDDGALKAYLSAIDWYPTVWADPILAAVKILQERGLNKDAKNLVAKNFEKATLPWSIFYLGQKLGEYKLGENDWTGAYCAYLKAKVGGENSPLNQVPEAPRIELLKKLKLLEAEHGLSPDQCNNAP